MGQDADLAQLLHDFEALIFFVDENQCDLLQQNLLIVASKAVIEDLTVTFNCRLQVLKRLLSSCDDTFGENCARMHISVLNELFRLIFAVQRVHNDKCRWLVQMSLSITLVARQVLVELTVELVLGFLDEDEATNHNEHLLKSLLLQGAH